MKKSTIVISVLVLIILGLCFGFFSLYSSNMDYKKRQTEYNELKNENDSLKKKVESYEAKENEDKGIFVSNNGEYDTLELISVNDLHIKMELKENFILLISQTGCGHCTAFKPVLNKVLEENDLVAYEINISNLSYDDRTFLSKLVKYSGTPTTLFYEDGEENLDYRIVGSAGEAKVVSRLESAGYIK